MPHQCVKCSKIIPMGSKEIIEGCADCGSKFFFYIRDEQVEKLKEMKEQILEIPAKEKDSIEKDVREIAGLQDENLPVILDLESVRSIGSGKFEIDVVNLFRKDRPIIYKLEEGKYIIDLSSSLSGKEKKDEED